MSFVVMIDVVITLLGFVWFVGCLLWFCFKFACFNCALSLRGFIVLWFDLRVGVGAYCFVLL